MQLHVEGVLLDVPVSVSKHATLAIQTAHKDIILDGEHELVPWNCVTKKQFLAVLPDFELESPLNVVPFTTYSLKIAGRQLIRK